MDDPYEVDEDKCRHDACVTLPSGFNKKNNEDVEYRQLNGGLYGVYVFYDISDKISLAYNNLFNIWLPGSGYKLDLINRASLEINRNNPKNDPDGKNRIDICIPIALNT